LESFDSLALVAIVFNSIKLIVVTLLLFAKQFTIQNIVLGFIACSFLELLLSYYYLSKKGRSLHKPIFDLTHYKAFIYESLPQLGVVLFDSALARIDWILLGIYSTVSITAEYSFAYKFFELSKLPLLIIGPILLTRFSKLFTNNATLNVETKESIQTLFNLEMFISLLIPIFMVICWSSLIDFITDNKYGAINQSTFTILAFCIPIHFIINFYWTLGFAQGQLKEIMWITIFASILNLILNIIIIPKFGGIGAASAFLLSSIAQLVAYHIVIKTEKLSISLNKPILMGISAFSIVAIFRIVSFNVYLSAILACILYICFGIITKQFSIAKIKTILYSS
jgi:O-antigen/teichoic acid export membrane protein